MPNDPFDVNDADPDEFADLAGQYPQLARLLASQPAPTMPDSVWTAIETRLAAQPPLVASTPHSPAVEVADLGAHRERKTAPGGLRRRAPLLSAAAGLVLVGAVGIPAVLGANSAPAPVADGAVTVPSVAADTNGPAEQPTVAAPGPTVSVAPRSTGIPARTVVASGTNYDDATMSVQVGELLGAAGLVSAQMPALDASDMTEPDTMAMIEQVRTVAGSDPTGYPPMIGSAGFTADVDDMRSCLDKLRQRLAATGPEFIFDPSAPAPALVVDRAQYQGADSGVVVLLNENVEGATWLDVAVIDPDCSDDDVAQAVLFSYDLP